MGAGPRLTLLASSSLAAFTLIYWVSMRSLTYSEGVIRITPLAARLLEPLAQLYFLALFAGLGLSAFGAYAWLRRSDHRSASPPTQLRFVRHLISNALSVRRNRMIFAAAATLYGVFYALVSSTIVYQPTVKFSETYLAEIPSIRLVLYYANPGQVPLMAVYLTENLGLLLIPVNLMLLLLISFLVGLNFALFSHVLAFRSRGVIKGNKAGWVGSLAAALALFTGCPTCAGLFFAYTLGGIAAASLAAALSSLQIAFIAASIPALLFTPLLMTRSLSACEVPGSLNRHSR